MKTTNGKCLLGKYKYSDHEIINKCHFKDESLFVILENKTDYHYQFWSQIKQNIHNIYIVNIYNLKFCTCWLFFLSYIIPLSVKL